MTRFLEDLVAGLSDGSIYAAIAVALVLVFRASDTINFGQGEMATFSTYLGWVAIVELHWNYVLSVIIVLAASFSLGVALQVGLVRLVARQSKFGLLLLTVGLFYLFNGLSTFVWGSGVKSFPSPAADRPLLVGGVLMNERSIVILAVTFVVLLLAYLFFRFTMVGLAMRAAATQPVDSSLVGVPVMRVQAIGWGLAALVGAVAGIVVAPVQFLEPDMMQTIIVFGFGAVVLGGADSLVGAVVGGLMLGCLLDFGTFLVPKLQALDTVVVLLVIVVVLTVRPNGLFGSPTARRL